MAYSLLSSIAHGDGSAVVNNPYPRIFTLDRYVYWTCKDVGTGKTAIQIWNVKDPSNPVFLSHTIVGFVGDDGANYNDLFVIGNTLYVTLAGTGTDGGFVIVDVTDKSNPSIIATYRSVEAGGTIADLHLPICLRMRGNYAYIGCFTNAKLLILDVSNPLNVTTIGTFQSHNGVYNSCLYQDDYVILCTYDPDPDIGGYIDVIDVSDPTAPVRAGHWKDPEGNWNYKLRNFRACYPIGSILLVLGEWWWTTSMIVFALDISNLAGIFGGGGLVTSGSHGVGSFRAIGDNVIGCEFLVCGWTGNAEKWISNINGSFGWQPPGVGSQHGGTCVDVKFNNNEFMAVATTNDIVLWGDPIPFPSVYYVNASGSDTAPYDTVEKGATSFGELFDNVLIVDGDTIEVVDDGLIDNSSYNEHEINASVVIRSYSGNVDKPTVQVKNDSGLFKVVDAGSPEFYNLKMKKEGTSSTGNFINFVNSTDDNPIVEGCETAYDSPSSPEESSVYVVGSTFSTLLDIRNNKFRTKRGIIIEGSPA